MEKLMLLFPFSESRTRHFTINNLYVLNVSVLEEAQPRERLLTTVKRRKLQYFSHVIQAMNFCTVPKYWKEESTAGENGENQDGDGQTM